MLDEFHLPVQAKNPQHQGSLPGSSMALLLSQVLLSQTQPLLVITPDTSSAQRLLHELPFFLGPEHGIPLQHFPDWEILPYDNFSPHQDIISERIKQLAKLPGLTHGLLTVSASTLMHRLAPTEFALQHSFMLKQGETLDRDTLRLQLEKSGYHYVSQVMEHGEFAFRGSLVDLFPMGSHVPYRIDCLGDEVDSIRSFDPETQRSIDTLSEIELLPAHEFPLTQQGIDRFRQNWRSHFSGVASDCLMYTDVSQGITPAGVEYYLPLFFEKTQTLFDYLPNNACVISLGRLHETIEHFWQDVKSRYEQHRHDKKRPILPPDQILMPPDSLFSTLKTLPRLILQETAIKETPHQHNFPAQALPDLTLENKTESAFNKLKTWLHDTPCRVLIGAETAGRQETLINLLEQAGIAPQPCASWQDFVSTNISLAITVAPIEQGFYWHEKDIALLAESDLLGRRVMQRRRREKVSELQADTLVRHLAELTPGAAVVHIEHGVGRYLGLQTLTVTDESAEFLTLEYAGGDKLYVPVTALHLVSRYSGADLEHAPLHRLGSEIWQKEKKKAAEKIHDVAAQLLTIYAQRAARNGRVLTPSEDHYASFSADFPFEETPDQEQAISHVVADMAAPEPMDRLICGDVGFGKTEVAIRAAFIAVENSTQVALLVPTTLLAQQHYETFVDRFAKWPISIACLSRFQTPKEQQAIIDKLKHGTLDIVIGTHKLIQQTIAFHDLGLLIIDEEHRFGVKQKETLKKMRAEVDILALTATPIPRTLNMALSSVRDLSIIATPPAKRLSIHTFVREHSRAIVCEAITRELLRGGQVYYLHNNVSTIEQTANTLQDWLPDARIAIAHGQMPERELEQIMSHFYHNHCNVLVCTTIIETGIDVPTANTIIMDRADKLGLAQLHQLRGRVGRSHHQAYAYLFTPPKKGLSADAVKRLDAISSLEDLGAGFTLATHDLEIRGAGEFLGEEQSGNMQAIGFSLYMELLERTVTALKSGQSVSLDDALTACEVELQIPARIPEHYLPDVHSRLVLYKRIANAKDNEALDELQVEMIDRFGLLPVQVKLLFAVTALKQTAEKLGIKKIKAGPQGGRLEFNEAPAVDPRHIIRLIQTQPQHYQLKGSDTLVFKHPMNDPQMRLDTVESILKTLAGDELKN